MNTLVVVWEWEDTHQIWLPYSAKTSLYLESCKANGQRNVNLGSAESFLSCYDVDLITMKQTRQETGMTRPIRRRLYPSVYPCGEGIQWQWNNDFTWVPYDISTSHTIEYQYQANPNAIIDLEATSIRIPNYIDLNRMVQVNKITGYKRDVERIQDVSLKYPIDNRPIGRPSSTNSFSNNHSLMTSGSDASARNSITSHQPMDIDNSSRTVTMTNGDQASMMASASGNDELHAYCKAVAITDNLNEECSICFEKLKDVSGFHDDNSAAAANLQKVSIVRELKKCPHKFHEECLLALIKTGAKDGWLQCPTCKVIQGVKQGSQPTDGTMQLSRQPRSLPGYPDCGMITIMYDFKTGIQGQEHPHPGKPYYASGFPRICYLPDNTKGQKVLRLLKKAWQRRLIFTIATSNTTGMDDTVVWNEIHHKTEPFSNISGHGYPDPNYLDNVLKELSIQGVEDSDDNSI